MDTEYRFEAIHRFRFTLDAAIPYFEHSGDTHDIDQIAVSFEWYEEDEDGPAGWNLDTKLLGWPLTAKGTRDKRIKARERVAYYRYPVALREVALEAYEVALRDSGIDPDLILNPHTGLLDPEKYLAA